MEMRRDSGRLLWGVGLLALGLMLLLGNFGFGSWIGWDRWWPLILIGVGLWIMLRRENTGEPVPVSPVGPAPAAAPLATLPSSSGPPSPGEAQHEAPRRRYPVGAIVLIGIGAAFLLDDVIGGNAFPAIVLIAIGVALVLRERSGS